MSNIDISERISDRIIDVSNGIARIKAERDDLENRLVVAAAAVDNVVFHLEDFSKGRRQAIDLLRVLRRGVLKI